MGFMPFLSLSSMFSNAFQALLIISFLNFLSYPEYRNTKVELGPEVQKKHLDVFMLQLKNSGYDKKFRKEIISSAWNAFEKMLESDKNGLKPLYRPRSWNKEARNVQKSIKKSNWWNTKSSKVQYKSVMFVTPTPGEVLMKSLQKRELELNKNDKERVKFVEKGGMKVKNILYKKNPFRKSKCCQKTCPMCFESDFVEASNSEEVKVACNTNNVATGGYA